MGIFKQFLFEATGIQQLPNSMMWIRSFFEHGLDTTTLKVWGDWCEENDLPEAAELFHTIGDKWSNPKLKRGQWKGNLINLFYNIFGHYPEYERMYHVNINTYQNSWFFHEAGDGAGQMRRHIVHPQQTSYRLSLTNGKWFSYTNDGNDRASVVSTRHVPTPDSERHYPQRTVSLKDYQPVAVENVPETVLLCAFHKLIEKQVRGGH